MERCKRSLVMAVGVDRKGRVGFATNHNLTEEGCTGEEGRCGCTHAEELLLSYVMRNPERVILTHSPCLECAKKLVDAGVKRVDYAIPYRLHKGIEYLGSHDVPVVGGILGLVRS